MRHDLIRGSQLSSPVTEADQPYDRPWTPVLHSGLPDEDLAVPGVPVAGGARPSSVRRLDSPVVADFTIPTEGRTYG